MLLVFTVYTVILNGNNTFTGDVVIESGTLQLGHPNALGTSAGIIRNVGSATLDLNGQSIAAEIGQFGGAQTFITNASATEAFWGGNLSISSSFLTFHAAAGNISVSGNISGGGGIVKSGDFILTLSGDNSGLVDLWNLQAGTLRLVGNKAVGAGVGITGGNSTLDINGQIVTNKTLIILETATVTNTSSVTAE